MVLFQWWQIAIPCHDEHSLEKSTFLLVTGFSWVQNHIGSSVLVSTADRLGNFMYQFICVFWLKGICGFVFMITFIIAIMATSFQRWLTSNWIAHWYPLNKSYCLLDDGEPYQQWVSSVNMTQDTNCLRFSVHFDNPFLHFPCNQYYFLINS